MGNNDVCLAEPKMKGKHLRKKWETAYRTQKMMDVSIASRPGMELGVKMMEKMGWKDGMGLGADLQGIIEPIKLKQTVNSKGLGFVNSGAEQKHYSAHFEKFESVLQLLVANNNSNSNGTLKTSNNLSKNTKKKGSGTPSSDGAGTSDSDSDSSDSDSPATKVAPTRTALEARSKNSTRRLHYQRFTRSKDTSRYSADDMACILGSKAHELYTSAQRQLKKDNELHGAFDTADYFNSAKRKMLDQLKEGDSESSSPASSGKCSPLPAASLRQPVSRDSSPEDSNDAAAVRPCFGATAGGDDEGHHRPGFGAGNDEGHHRPGFGAGNDEGQHRPGFGSSRMDDGSRPCFGGVGFEMNPTQSTEDKFLNCMKSRYASNYMSSFVKSSEGIGATVNNTTEDSASLKQPETSMSVDLANQDKMQEEFVEVDLHPTTKKKKKNKRKEVSVNVPKEDGNSISNETKSHKNNKKDIKEMQSEFIIIEDEVNSIQTNSEDLVISKKKKRKSKNNKSEIESPVELPNEINDSSVVEPSVVSDKKKKSKKRERVVDLNESMCEIVDVVDNIIYDKMVIYAGKPVAEPPKKKRKKDRKREEKKAASEEGEKEVVAVEDVEQNQTGKSVASSSASDEDPPSSASLNEPTKKKKSKKQVIEIEEESQNVQEEVYKTKKKKNKKSKRDSIAVER